MAQQPPKVGDVLQSGNIKRTVLGVQDAPPGYQTVKVVSENPANTCGGRHHHDGLETSYLMEGEATFKIDGQPDRLEKPGGHWELAPGVVHDACSGPQGSKVLVTYVLPKGSPIATLESTADSAKAMLAKAVAAVKADREIAFAQMLKGENGFLDGDVYPFCSKMSDGKTIVSPRAVPAGTDVRTLKDAAGRAKPVRSTNGRPAWGSSTSTASWAATPTSGRPARCSVIPLISSPSSGTPSGT
jgi:quercetin dioxygenase-like cupin family protein